MPFISSPNAGQTLGNTRDQIRNNIDDLKASLAVNHIDLDLSGVGKHKFVQMPVQASAPTTSSGEVALYAKTTSGATRLFMRRSSNAEEVQMSGVAPDTSSEGFTFLPGGLLIQWGQVSSSSSTLRTVTFPTAFTAATVPLTIQITGVRANSDPGSVGVFVITGTETNTGFQFRNNGGHTLGFYWMAIGFKV